MALTNALSNESHPVTVYLMTCYGRRQALGARWHAQLDALAAVGPVLDTDLAGRLGDAFELCAVVDLADVPPYLAFLEALDPGITAGFLTRAGFEPPPGQEPHRGDSAVPEFACWRKKAPATTAGGGEEIDQFLTQGWILANLYRLYRSLVRDTDPGLLRQILTTGHGDRCHGRGGASYLRPLWDAYLTAGRAQLRDLGNLTADEPEFVPRWARGDLILGSTLIDIKTGWDVRDRLDYCLNQMLGYLLLNPANQYAIDRIGVYLARYATTVTWPVTMVLPELTGQPDRGLHQLQQEFAAVCQPSIDQDLSWLQPKQAKDQPRHP